MADEHEHHHDHKTEFDYRKLLLTIPMNESFPKACCDTNNHREEMIFIPMVINFIKKHLDDSDVYKSILIEENIRWLSDHLRNCGEMELGAEMIQGKPGIAQRIAERTRMELSWISLGLHKLLNFIISKYQDENFLIIGLHRSLIYFALDTVASLCKGQHKEVVRAIFFETDIIKIALQILKNDEMTFIEHTACTEIILRSQAFIEEGGDKRFWVDLLEKYDLNVIKLLIKQCVNCFKLTSFHKALKPYHDYILSYWSCADLDDKTHIKSQEDIPKYQPIEISKKNKITKNIHYKMVTQRYLTLSALILMASRFQTDPNSIIWEGISSMDLKRLLQMSTIYMREGSQSASSKTGRPTHNSTDILVYMIQHKIIAEKLVADDEIVQMLIICLRSRGRMCEYNYREIVPILYYIIVEHEVFPKQYINDAILGFMDLLEEKRKNLSMAVIPGLPALITLIVRSLKYLFDVPKYTRVDQDEYLCPICQNELDFPHAIKCGHNMCYNCLTPLIYAGMTNYQRYVLKIQPKNQCPICREPFDGIFDREDKKSAFVLNVELCNKMNSSVIVLEDDKEDEFKGTESDYYQYLKTKNNYNYHKQNLKSIIFSTEMVQKYDLMKAVEIIVEYVSFDMVQAEFEKFCDFMMWKAKVYDPNDIKEDQKKHILMAKDVKKEGNLLFKQKKYIEAIQKYEQCLLICPLWHEDRAIYYGNIGICYQKMKDWPNLFRISQKALSANCVAVKPLSHATIGLSKMLLTENDNLNLINNNLHYKICLDGKNDKCLTRRVYDVILFQLAWDCQFFYTQTKAQTMAQMVQKLRKCRSAEEQFKLQQEMMGKDDLLRELKEIQTDKVERCLPLNYEEAQYYRYYWLICDMKKNIHDFIVDQMLNEKKESISIMEIIEPLKQHYTHKKLYAYLRFINLDTIIFIVNHSNIISVQNDKQIYLSHDNDIIDNYKMLQDKNNSTDDDDVMERNKMIQKVYKIHETSNKEKNLEQVLFEDVNHNPDLTMCAMYMWELEKID